MLKLLSRREEEALEDSLAGKRARAAVLSPTGIRCYTCVCTALKLETHPARVLTLEREREKEKEL